MEYGYVSRGYAQQLHELAALLVTEERYRDVGEAVLNVVPLQRRRQPTPDVEPDLIA